MVTRDDVARRAGVSTAVVSYVLNDGPRPVAAATREKVLAAVVELGYRPNALARSLKTNRSLTLGLIVPNSSNSFFAQLAEEIGRFAFDHNVSVMLGSAGNDPDHERRIAQTFAERRVEGVVLAITDYQSRAAVDLLVKAGIPVVAVDRDIPGAQVSAVLVENFHGGYLATKHLLDHGHVRVACLSGPRVVPSAADRVRGWERALSENELASSQDLLVESDFSRKGAHEAALRLLDREDRPTAVFVAADEQAFGVYRAAADLGLRVAHDVAVVSFDSTDLAEFTVPALTSVHQPVKAMARHAVERLQARITGDRDEFTRDVLPVRLDVRASCGCQPPSPAGAGAA